MEPFSTSFNCNPTLDIGQNPGPDGVIRRSSRMPNTVPGISRFPQGVTISQQRIERLLQESILHNSTVDIKRNMFPIDLVFDPTHVGDGEIYPITVKLGHVEDFDPLSAGPSQGDKSTYDAPHGHDPSKDDRHFSPHSPSKRQMAHQIIHSKYVLGCDGAHSWIRKQLGVTMEGDQTEYVWGAIGKSFAQHYILPTSLTALVIIFSDSDETSYH